MTYLIFRRFKLSQENREMKQDDDKKSEKDKKTPPDTKETGGELAYFRKPKPNPQMDVGWFYDDEEFFAEHMDEFDW